MPNSPTTARLEARISPELHALLKCAAELQGRTLTDFVVSAVQEAAQQAVEQAGIVRLSLEDQRCFAEALLAPTLSDEVPSPCQVRVDRVQVVVPSRHYVAPSGWLRGIHCAPSHGRSPCQRHCNSSSPALPPRL